MGVDSADPQTLIGDADTAEVAARLAGSIAVALALAIGHAEHLRPLPRGAFGEAVKLPDRAGTPRLAARMTLLGGVDDLRGQPNLASGVDVDHRLLDLLRKCILRRDTMGQLQQLLEPGPLRPPALSGRNLAVGTAGHRSDGDHDHVSEDVPRFEWAAGALKRCQVSHKRATWIVCRGKASQDPPGQEY